MSKKIVFLAPVVFLVSAFLAYRISEQRIVLLSVFLMIISLTIYADKVGLSASIEKIIFSKTNILILPIAINLIFLLPDKIKNLTTLYFKLLAVVFPFVIYLLPNINSKILEVCFTNSGVFIPWPLVLCLAPLTGNYIYNERKTNTLSPAVTGTLLFFIFPCLANVNQTILQICYFFAGLILLHALYRLYWDNSYIDELTGLYNRRALDERMKKLRRNYSLAMSDIDHFKKFNDTYGHDAGDDVLRLVATLLYQHFGKNAYRYGGEEFCVVFSKTDTETSAKQMNEARMAIEMKMFSIRQKGAKRKKSGRKKSLSNVKKVQVTISSGVASFNGKTKDAAKVLKNADTALYAAKENGRNRVEIKK
ncbi:MAG: GGDEF domain-containing protein [Spirochaetales bacterium]|nr:GGDEF domain-containing protein [Spirochaetales bacterium]